jgi:5-methylcytosine-specific restriction endonuclease McrA
VVDHIEPVISPSAGFISWDTYYLRLFVNQDQMQGLCKKCHSEKTRAENAERRLNAKKE